MIIVDAIRRARTEHVVYFLLSAWLEMLAHTGRARVLPDEAAARMPVRSSVDVTRRLRLIREKLASDHSIPRSAPECSRTAACALHAARIKLSDLWVRATHRRRERLARRRSYVAWRLARERLIRKRRQQVNT